MSLIHVDNLLTEQKSKQNKQKDKQNTEKKLNRKVKFKISKYGFKKPTNMTPIQEEQPELNNCKEWQSSVKSVLIKLLSFPAMSDKSEFEEALINSNDVNECIDHIPLFQYSRFLPYWAVGLLSYGSLYMKVKTNKLAKINNIKYDKQTEKTEPKSMLNFTIIKPEN